MATGLELRLWWGNHLVAEHFFRADVERSYRVGSGSDADFPLSSSVLGVASHELVRGQRHGPATLRLSPRMRGTLRRFGAEPVSFEQTIASGVESEDELTLAAGDLVTLELGPVRGELRARSAPRHVTVPFFEGTDFAFANTVLAAAAASLFFIIAAVNHTADDSSLDDFTTASRTKMVHLLVTKAPPPPPTPRAIERREASTGASTQTKPVAGRSKPQPGPVHGNMLAALHAGGIAALFGPHGLDHGLTEAMGGLRVAETHGVGGLDGRSLRGNAGLGGPGETIGATGIDIRGRHQGEGIGARLTAGKRYDPAVSNESLESSSPLDRELIRQVIHSHRDQIRYCYEQMLTQAPDLGGKVAIRFVISGEGVVTASHVTESSTASAQLDNCVAGRARTWVFPKPKGGGLVAVTYPFVFKQAGK